MYIYIHIYVFIQARPSCRFQTPSLSGPNFSSSDEVKMLAFDTHREIFSEFFQIKLKSDCI